MLVHRILLAGLFLVASTCAHAELKAGVATVSITPQEEDIVTRLGGYGARQGKPAEGVLDTLNAKCLVFEWNGGKSAIVTLDICGVPLSLVEESVRKAGVDGLTAENTIMAASHTHAGLDTSALNKRNVLDLPQFGGFSEEVFEFVTGRIAGGLVEASGNLEPVHAASGHVEVEGAIRNRRNSPCLDTSLTVLRLDTAEGEPFAVIANFTAHPTLVSAEEMLLSGEWPGHMQRTVEALMPGVTCLYTNGAQGDQTAVEPRAGSKYQQTENYGRRVGIAAARLAEQLEAAPVETFNVIFERVELPPQQIAPDFMESIGSGHGVSPEMVDLILSALFPGEIPIFGLRINDFALVSFPGEPICDLGTAVKDTLRRGGIANPIVTGLTGDNIGYILTADEYAKGGYEVNVSFYGPDLGAVVLDATTAVAEELVRAN